MGEALTINGRGIDIGDPIDISIPLRFDGEQPNAYDVPRAASEACVSGDLVGDTRQGGSCNFEQYTLIPHCNGTHTECVGHITKERISIKECLKDAFVPAVLVSVEAIEAREIAEGYAVQFGAGDRVITRSLLMEAVTPQAALAGRDAGAPVALILRTLPNDISKMSREYGGEPLPPYFTSDAMEYIVECGFRHLLVDMPSIDRLFDEGRLSNHRIFWNVQQDSFDINADTRVNDTITELIFVPDGVEDGEYMLNLQIAPFAADASPSRPLLFRYV